MFFSFLEAVGCLGYRWLLFTWFKNFLLDKLVVKAILGLDRAGFLASGLIGLVAELPSPWLHDLNWLFLLYLLLLELPEAIRAFITIALV